jgi:hypothetical protein
MPVSGSVKRFYESSWPVPHGGWPGNLAWQASWLSRHVGAPLTAPVDRAGSWLRVGGLPTPAGRLAAIALGVTAALGWLVALRRPGGAERRWWLALAVGTLLHWASFVLLLPSFMASSVWYLAPEILVGWVALGLGLEAAGALASCAAAVVLLLGAAGWSLPVAGHEPNTRSVFVEAGRWMNETLPPGARVATLSSGFVGFAAPRHHVVNLDGLMNDRRYFEEYLRRGRVPDYVRDTRLEYFADYRRVSAWRGGVQWQGQIPIERLQLLRWWPFGGGRGPGDSLAYAVWRVLEPGQPPPACERGCDRPSQVQFEAAALGTWPLVADRDLPGFLAGRPGDRVATSLFMPFLGLHHVVVPAGVAPALGFSRQNVAPAGRAIARFGDAIDLLALRLSSWRVRPGDVLVMSRAWAARHAVPPGRWRADTYIKPTTPGWFWHVSEPCHGTCPIAQWRTGEVVVETYALSIPGDLPPGAYPVRLGLWDMTTRSWMAGEGAAAGLVTLGTLDVRR